MTDAQERVTPPNTSGQATPKSVTFERVLRDCPHNDELKHKGSARGFLYDFKAIVDGQHVAWWCQYSPNGGTDTHGYRYWLRDKMWLPVQDGAIRGSHPVAARNREELESVLIANLSRIPTDDELAQRRAHQENTGQMLEADDAAIVKEIEARYRTGSSKAISKAEATQ